MQSKETAIHRCINTHQNKGRTIHGSFQDWCYECFYTLGTICDLVKMVLHSGALEINL